jgi:hypothetical protein
VGVARDDYLTQRRGPTHRTGNPDDLGGPADFARALGHADASTLSHWLTDPPPGFPEPDTWTDLPSGRRRPKWQLRRIRAFADTRPYRGQRSGRRPGTRANATPYADDPRLALARRALATHPDARNADLIPHLQATAAPEHTSSRSTWHRILNAARRSAADGD